MTFGDHEPRAICLVCGRAVASLTHLEHCPGDTEETLPRPLSNAWRLWREAHPTSATSWALFVAMLTEIISLSKRITELERRLHSEGVAHPDRDVPSRPIPPAGSAIPSGRET